MHEYRAYSECHIYGHECTCTSEYKASSDQYSTGYEPGYCYYLNAPDLSYDLFHNHNMSLENPKPHHRSNTRMHSTKTQHHHEPSPRSHDDFLNTPSQGLHSSPTVVAIVAGAKAEDVVDTVDVVDVVDVVDAEKAVKAEIAMAMGNRVSAPIAKLTAIPQMQAGNGNALRREETAEETAKATMSAFERSAGSQATIKSIASPTNM
jgi:hypothetical protein